jgi:hypothetical protein
VPREFPGGTGQPFPGWDLVRRGDTDLKLDPSSDSQDRAEVGDEVAIRTYGSPLAAGGYERVVGRVFEPLDSCGRDET